MLYIRTNLPYVRAVQWEDITKVHGCPLRHIEQLYDDIRQLKERVKELEKKANNG